VAHAVAAQDADTGDPPGQTATWTFHLTPYLWASGIEGEVGVRDRSVEVDVGFSDIIKNLDGAAMLAGGARRDALGVGFELLWVKLSTDRATPGPLFTSAEMGAKQLMLELTGRYRILPPAPVNVEAFLGGRFWRLNNSLDLTQGALPAIEVSDTQRWFDPIVGVSAVSDLSTRWLVQARGDVGGFDVGSELTWQLLGAFGYRFNESWDVRAGYRYLDVDYTNGGFLYDVATSGIIMGVTYAFE
jgi:opacity protein-like surface antigen